MSHAIEFRNVSYPGLLQEFSCDIATGSTALIVTARNEESLALAHVATGVLQLNSGAVLVDDQDITDLDPIELNILRRQIGVVSYNGGLVSNLKVWENITLCQQYFSGGVSDDEEQTALACLQRFGYSSSLMALPAHIPAHEKQMAALVRMFLRQPRIIMYVNCFEGATTSYRSTFFEVSREFHAGLKDRTSIYITSSPDLAKTVQVDMIFSLKRPAEFVSRTP